MQFDLNRAFPYPVLRPGVDDYVDGDFQVAVQFQQSEGDPNIALDVEFGLSVEEIRAAIDNEYASFVAVVSCRDTYFRQALQTREETLRATIDAADLRGRVEVFPYVVVQKTIARFSSRLINPEFGPAPFRLEVGSVLALEEPKAVYLERDLFRPVSSVFELTKSEGIGVNDWRVVLSDEKVQIALSPSTKEKIDGFRNNTKSRAILLNSIYFSAIMHCLAVLRRDEEYDDCRWAQVFRQQCHNHNIDLNVADEYHAAQLLLKSPLGLMNSYVFESVGE